MPIVFNLSTCWHIRAHLVLLSAASQPTVGVNNPTGITRDWSERGKERERWRRLRRGVFPPSVHFKANSTFSTSTFCLVITTRVQWHAARPWIRILIAHFEKSIVTSFNLHRPKAINNAYLSTHSFSLLLAYYPSPSLSPCLHSSNQPARLPNVGKLTTVQPTLQCSSNRCWFGQVSQDRHTTRRWSSLLTLTRQGAIAFD